MAAYQPPRLEDMMGMDLPDVDLSNVDFNDPASFFKALGGGAGTNLPIPELMPPQEVRQNAKSMSTQIFKDWHLLQHILDRHESTIHKRWLKRTRNQRVEILLAAWPKVSTSHRPDFAAFKKESEAQRDSGTKFREAYMYPHINLEDLAKAKTLLLFLRARARNPPDVFAAADEETAHLGYVSKAIIPIFLNQYTMYLTGRKTPATYGELVAWDDDNEAFNDMNTRTAMLPGSGLLVLEMQQRVMGFLVDCCKKIMHDIPEEALEGDTYPVQDSPPLQGETAQGFASLAIMAAEAPYRPPANLDLNRLQSLLEAKKSAAEDHIWALREDPKYFAETLAQYKEHRQEMIRDRAGKEHPVLKPALEDTFWQRIIGTLVSDVQLQLQIWSELLVQVGHLLELQSRYAEQISPTEILPDEYLDALLRFQHYLKHAAKGPLNQLKLAVVASPPLRPYFVREIPQDRRSSMIQVAEKPGLRQNKIAKELVWLLETLWEDGQPLFLMRMTSVVDELERLIQSEPKASELISSRVTEILSDLSVVTEALRQLSIYQPWAQTFENLLVDREDGIRKEFANHSKNWSYLLGVIDGPARSKIIELGRPSEQKFYYPIEKRRTKENVGAMRDAERNLDAFWAAVDENMRMRVGDKLNGTALMNLLAQSKILQRTPEWVERDRKDRSQGTDAEVEAICKPLSELYFDLEHRTERTIDRSRTKSAPVVKAKTRGIPRSDIKTDEPTDDHFPVTRNDVQPTFPVDARALKTFRTLFHTPSISATPGEVPWTDFLHAMVSTGFVPEKLYGSVWQFSPTGLDVERSIQFHEPHPSGRIPFMQARRFGRRLDRAYGWHGRLFVLREKK
ncbi:MAG: hypothetical protein Q9227_005771 [Pyrenula ochraceoflavens]